MQQEEDQTQNSADGRSPYSHLRQAKFTENQAVIDPHVDDQGYTGNNERDPYRFRTAERGENGLCDKEEDKCIFDDGHVGHSFRSDRSICREDRHQLRGEDQAERPDQKPAAGSQLQAASADLAQRADILPPPVLGADNDQRVANTNRELLNHKEDLVHGGSSRKRHLGVASQHQVIRHIDAVGHDVLQRDSQQDREQPPVKHPVF